MTKQFGHRPVAGIFAGLTLALLSACGGGGNGSSGGAASAPPGAIPRTFQRADSSVSISTNGSQMTATQTVTLSNDTAQKQNVTVQFYTPVGSISSAPVSTAPGLPGVGGLGGGGAGNPNDYQIAVTLRGIGDTEQQARDALASMTVSHSDSITADSLYLGTQIQFGGPNSQQRDASIQAQLPATLSYRLHHSAEVGSISASGLSGPSADFDASVGALTLDGTWPSVVLTNSVGSITFSGTAESLRGFSSAGSVKATLTVPKNLQADLGSEASSVDVGLTSPSASAGYDLYADTSAGTATITVAGTSAQGTQDSRHAHYRSANYDSASPKALVHARSSSGSVTIHN